MSKFSDVVSGLAQDGPENRIQSIKGAIKEQLQTNDSSLSVELTDHFNHSFVPDLLLRWPNRSEVRKVYLRTSVFEDALLRDIQTLGDERPILMPLRRHPSNDAGDVVTSAAATDTLVTSPEALETFARLSSNRPMVSFFSHSVLQGGRGVIRQQDVASASEALEAGFSGAGEGDPQRTTSAIETAAAALDAEHAGRINRLLHAAWLGSGATSTAFPGAAGVTGTLDPDSLRFILGLPPIENDQFWDHLGASLSTELLCNLRDQDPSPNLNSLLAQIAYRLKAKACRVLRVPGSAESPDWSIRAGNLVLALPSEQLHFAPTRVDQLPEAGEKVDVSVAQLTSRSRGAGVVVREVTLEGTNKSVSLSSEAQEGVTQDDELTSIQAAMRNVRLRSSVVGSSEQDIRVNFDTRTASGNGPAKFLLSTLSEVVLPVLVAPTASTAEAVSAALEQPVTRRAAPDSD